jgi:hypothetical protein
VLTRDELLAELERLQRRVTDRDGPDFIVELVRLRGFLDEDPRLQQILAALRAEASQIEAEFSAADAELVPRIIDLKRELLELAPDAADADPQPRPQWPQRDYHWIHSMTNFDLVAADDEKGVIERHGLDTSKAGFLLRVLEARLHGLQWLVGDPPAQQAAEENQRPELEPLSDRLARLTHEHRAALRSYERAVGSHGGFALIELDMVLDQADPPEPNWDTKEDEVRYANEVFTRALGRFHLIEEALRPEVQRNLDANEREQLQRLIDKLRPIEDRLFEAVREQVLHLPSPRLGLGRYLRDWLLSPFGAVLVVAPAGQGVIQLVSDQGKASGWLFAFAVVAAILPPLARVGLSVMTQLLAQMSAPGERGKVRLWFISLLENASELDVIWFDRRIVLAANAAVALILLTTLTVSLTLGLLVLAAAIVGVFLRWRQRRSDLLA